MTYPTLFVTTTIHGRDRLVEGARVGSGQRPPVRCPARRRAGRLHRLTEAVTSVERRLRNGQRPLRDAADGRR